MDDEIRDFLAEQKIEEYEKRLAHLDGLLARAHDKVGGSATPEEHLAQLESLTQQRDKLASWLDEARGKPIEHWKVDEIQKAGPMGIWDAVAQQLESLVERIER